MDLVRKVNNLESLVRRLMSQNANTITRGTLVEVDDETGLQETRVRGYYDEEIPATTNWQPFGLSTSCPPGADALIACVGGNRDGAQVIAVSHPDFRPAGAPAGTTILYDAFGNTVVMTDEGVAISNGENVVKMTDGGLSITSGSTLTIDAADVEITSGTLTHNGKNIGDDHKHDKVTAGASNTGEPV